MIPQGTRRSLKNKLSINKENLRITLVNPFENFERRLGKLPGRTTLDHGLNGIYDLILYCPASKKELEEKMPELKQHLYKNGGLWICWPKLTSGIKSDLMESIVQEAGLRAGLVDVKVVAIDVYWSGLKFVYRLADR